MSAPAWTSTPVLGFDLETTGINAHEDRIVTASVVRIPVGATPSTFDWLADPGVDIPDGAAAVHGITTEKAQTDGRPIADVLDEVTTHLAFALDRGVPIVAFNAAYDLTMLEAENHRHGVPTLTSRVPNGIAPVIDPMVLDKQADPYRRAKGGCGWTGRNGSPDRLCGCGATDKTLTSLCKHYGVTLDNAHTSAADSLAAGHLWTAILAQHPQAFRDITDVHALHRAQVGWRRKQQDSLRAYFDRAGTEHDGCDGGWPLYAGEQLQLDGVA